MIIRSQDKESIINFSHIDTICIVEEEIQYFNGVMDSKGILGTYSTEEKAIKVLDMIQEAYLKTTRTAISSNLEVNSLPVAVVFQMPQDSEV